MTIAKEIKVGILAVVSFTSLYLGFNFLKGSDFFSSDKTYYVVFNDAQGLLPSCQVILNGAKVGLVKAVELQQDTAHTVKVTLAIQKDLIIPADSKTILASDGLLGAKILRLQLGNAQVKPLAEGGFLVGQPETGLTDLLKAKATPALGHLDSLLVALNSLAYNLKGTSHVLNSLLKNADQTFATLNATLGENRNNLHGITGNLKNLSGNLVETEKQLKPLLGKFNSIADSLQALQMNQTLIATQQSLKSLNQVLAGIQAGNGTMGKLMKDDSLYKSLNKTMVDLDKLLIDFRLAPKRYVNISVFGRKSTPPVVK